MFYEDEVGQFCMVPRFLVALNICIICAGLHSGQDLAVDNTKKVSLRDGTRQPHKKT